MAAAAIFQLTGRGVQDTVKDRNEHRRVTLAYQHIIDVLQAVARRKVLQRGGLQ